MDFDHIEVRGALLPPTDVQLEVCYREAVVDPPVKTAIGEPFFDPFPILALQAHEIAAEKMRTLAQRTRPTDLADLAVVLGTLDVDDASIARIAEQKFKIVSRGSRADRIKTNIDQIGAEYDLVVPPLFPEAPGYREAVETVWPRIKPLIP